MKVASGHLPLCDTFIDKFLQGESHIKSITDSISHLIWGESSSEGLIVMSLSKSFLLLFIFMVFNQNFYCSSGFDPFDILFNGCKIIRNLNSTHEIKRIGEDFILFYSNCSRLIELKIIGTVSCLHFNKNLPEIATLSLRNSLIRQESEIPIVFLPDGIISTLKHIEFALKLQQALQVIKPFYFFWPNPISEESEALNLYEKFIKSRLSVFPSLNADFYLVFNGPNTNISIYEFYSIKEIRFFSLVHSFQSQLPQSPDCTLKRILSTSSEPKIGRRRDFQGVKLTISAGNDSDYTYETDFRVIDDKVVFVSGLAASIYWNFRDYYNFTTNEVVGEWITENIGEPLGGLAEGLLDGSTDLSIAQTLITPRKSEDLKFLHPTITLTLAAIFVQPSSNQLNNVFLSPFQNQVWFCLIGVWIILSLSYLAIYKFGPKEEDDDTALADEIYLWAMSVFCQQGWYICPASGNLKLVFFMGIFTGFIVYIAYSAIIISTLSVHRDPIASYAELVDYPGFKFFADNETTPNFLLEGADLGRDFKIEGSEISDLSSVVHRVFRKGSVFLSFLDNFYPAAFRLEYKDQDLCEHISTFIIGNDSLKLAMNLKRGSPFSQFFNHRVTAVKERGLNFRYIKIYDKGTTVQCTQRPQGHQAITITATSSAFLFLTGIFTISLTSLWLEITWKNYKRRNKARIRSFLLM